MKKSNEQSDQVTIKDIADDCGISAMTVSRALRSDSSVANATRRKVLDAAERLGYRPRVRMGRPRAAHIEARASVEVIMGTHLQHLFYSVLLIAIERELARRHYDCVIRTSNGKFKEFVKLCELLRGVPPKPTLVVGYLPLPQLRTLLEVRPNALLVDHTGDPRLEVPYSYVGFDNAEAARMMVRRLISDGRKNILLLKGFEDHYFTREMEQGYREALVHAGIKVREELILATDFSADGAVAVLKRAMEDGVAFDAVLSNDEMAAGVLHVLDERGLKVPGDIAVAGCDGLPFGRYTIPPLSTVLLDHVELGRLAVEHILSERRELAPPTRVRLLPKLELRASTGDG